MHSCSLNCWDVLRHLFASCSLLFLEPKAECCSCPFPLPHMVLAEGHPAPGCSLDCAHPAPHTDSAPGLLLAACLLSTCWLSGPHFYLVSWPACPGKLPSPGGLVKLSGWPAFSFPSLPFPFLPFSHMVSAGSHCLSLLVSVPPTHFLDLL